MFGFMYRLGLTPWEGHPLPERLYELVEGQGALPAGKAIDLGCGTGEGAVYLAKHGWDVTGVDFVEKALARAGRRAEIAGVTVRWIQADVTRLGDAAVGADFALVIDSGCLHLLDDEARVAYVREVGAIVAPGGTLFVVAFPTGGRRPPRGIDRREIEERFSTWRLVGTGPAQPPAGGRPLYWYELRAP